MFLIALKFLTLVQALWEVIEFGESYQAPPEETGKGLASESFCKEKGIDYEEVFALVTSIEAIRLFLAYASFMGFTVYQMDVKILGTVRFGNDQFAPILGYRDLVQGNVTINRVYYVEGLNHNLFSVGQFCDADLEVAFRKSTCFVRDLQATAGELSVASTACTKIVVGFKDRSGCISLRLYRLFAPILGYGDLVQGKVTINRVYYVEGLNHNLFSVGQFCDADLEVAFRKSTCFVRDLQGNDLLTDNRGLDLYIISPQESTSSTPLCLMSKAIPTQSWLWHRRLSHLNFDYINLLSKKDIVIGLPKLKYVKDQLCSSCKLSEAKRSPFKSKAVSSLKGRLNLIHMDL
nr:retrovirus-related Pol polyprotein from transposon TNT 1-94 [Tanacetum cinerariifolium]